MSAQTEIIRAIKAVQADRKVAAAAGKTDQSDKLFDTLVDPLNQQLAGMAPGKKDELAEMQRALDTLDAGLAQLTGEVDEEHLVNTRAQTEVLRKKVGGGSSPKPSVNPDIPSKPPVALMDTPKPAPAGPPEAFVAARRTGPKAVTYIDGKGREIVRTGGSRAWRNNNPGNIRKGSFAENQGSIGDDGAFAIFPSEAAGLDGIVALLRAPAYGKLTLEGAINRYAPPLENDTASYVAFVVKETGIAKTEVLDDLPVAGIRKIAGAIRSIEGWTPGAEQPNMPVSGAPALALAGSAATGGISSAVGAMQDWMAVAEQQAALPAHERSAWPDPGENPRILEYFHMAAAWFDAAEGDETDWCAAFVNYCLMTSGHIGTDHPGARSFFWNKKKQFVSLAAPAKGCIAVRRYAPFSDAQWKTGKGHVGFVVGSSSDSVTLLGGNQDHTVCRKTFPLETKDASGKLASKFVAFMMPVMN